MPRNRQIQSVGLIFSRFPLFGSRVKRELIALNAIVFCERPLDLSVIGSAREHSRA
jgi:hypothetical protein